MAAYLPPVISRAVASLIARSQHPSHCSLNAGCLSIDVGGVTRLPMCHFIFILCGCAKKILFARIILMYVCGVTMAAWWAPIIPIIRKTHGGRISAGYFILIFIYLYLLVYILQRSLPESLRSLLTQFWSVW